MSLKPYSEYKDSGVEWLGEVPKHWTVQPATAMNRIITSTVDKKSYEDEIPVRLCNYTDVYYNDTVHDDPNYMKSTASLAQIALFTPMAGDVAITKDSESSADIGIPSYVPFDLPGVVFGYHLAIYRSGKGSYGRFLKYLFESKYVKTTFENKTLGVTRVGLSQNTLKYLRVPTPQSHEIEAIVDYLDWETAEIDAFIVDQEKLIDLLNERRNAAIRQAVMKGLDQNVKLKASGLDWFPEIPAHWSMIKGSNAASVIQTGPFGSQVHAHEYVDDGIPLINPQHIVDGRIVPDSRKGVDQVKATGLARHFLQEGDVIVARRGELGRSAVVTEGDVGFICGTGSLLIRPIMSRYDPRYFQLVFSSDQNRVALNQASVGATMDNLSAGTVINLKLPAPPLDEQRQIVKHIERETAEIDAAVADAREAVALSKERRAAVISAAVTGKIDVRDLLVPASTNEVGAESVGVA